MLRSFLKVGNSIFLGGVWYNNGIDTILAKNKMKIKTAFILFLILAFPSAVFAVAQSEDYKITVDNFGFAGDDGSSEDYHLSDTIGEPIVGAGSSEDYSVQDGFWYKENVLMTLVLDTNTEDLGALTPGTPNTGETVVTVTTDCVAGYELLVSQDAQMTHTNTVDTISDYSCSIASPCAWSGTGLGFSITDGTSVDVKWGTSPNFNYAAFPLSSTKIHEKTTYSLNGDNTTIEYKVDVLSTQKSGIYSNNITYVAISKL